MALDGSAAIAGQTRPTPARRVPADAWLAAALVMLALLISAVGTLRAPSLSAFDEATHIDYVWKLAHGRVPFGGDVLAPEVLQEWSCRSQDNIADQLPPCGSDAPASAYPAAGQNYNAFHPPLYYATAAVGVRAVGALAGDVSFVTVARLTGGVWLALALVGLYLVLRSWRVSPLVAVSGAAALGAVPSVAHAASTVTNDAPAALCGVLALAVLTRAVRHDGAGWLVPGVVALLVASTKVINSLGFVAVALVLLALAVGRARAGRRRAALRLTTTSLSILVATAVLYFLWDTVQDGRRLAGWKSPIAGYHTAPVEGLPVEEWLPTLLSAVGLAHDYWLQASVASFIVPVVARALTVLFTAAPFASLALFERGDGRRVVGWAALAGAVAAPAVVQLNAYVGSGTYFVHVTSRYALSLVPLTVVALALVADARRWRVASAAVGLGAAALVVLSFAGAL